MGENDRQTDRKKTVGENDRQTNRKKTVGENDRQTDRKKPVGENDRQTDRKKPVGENDRQTDRQKTVGENKRQTNRETESKVLVPYPHPLAQSAHLRKHRASDCHCVPCRLTGITVTLPLDYWQSHSQRIS